MRCNIVSYIFPGQNFLLLSPWISSPSADGFLIVSKALLLNSRHHFPFETRPLVLASGGEVNENMRWMRRWGGWVDWWMHRFAAGWQEGIEAAAHRRNLLATYPTRVLHATNQRRTRPITAPRLSSTNESAPPGRGCARRPWPTNQSAHTWLHCTTLGSCKHHMSFIKLYSRRFLAAWYYKFFQATAVKQPSTH